MAKELTVFITGNDNRPIPAISIPEGRHSAEVLASELQRCFQAIYDQGRADEANEIEVSITRALTQQRKTRRENNATL